MGSCRGQAGIGEPLDSVQDGGSQKDPDAMAGDPGVAGRDQWVVRDGAADESRADAVSDVAEGAHCLGSGVVEDTQHEADDR